MPYTHKGTEVHNPAGQLVISFTRHDSATAEVVADMLNDETERLRQQVKALTEERDEWKRQACAGLPLFAT